MSLFNKLTLAPDQAGYAVTDGTEVFSVQLDGGASRFRKDVLNAHDSVNVQWRVNPEEFHYLKSFYNLVADKGAKTFLLDLYLDREVLTEHECHFVPGSFRLTGQRGKQFTVAAKLEVKPIILTEEEELLETAWVTLFSEFGSEYQTLFPPIEALFDQIITYDLPYDLLGFAAYTVEEPEEGWLRTFDPENDPTWKRDALLATMVYDLKNDSIGTYTITEPAAGWTRTFDPSTEEGLGSALYDVTATLANELNGTVEAYTVQEPSEGRQRALSNDSLVWEKASVLASILLDLQEAGTIG